MEFGYFTLSDNHYPNNPRSANQLVMEIREQAILADRLGMHSAWIGEHHFDSLGVNSRPDLLLANIASQTKNIRLAPAVTVLPLHHPVHVAEMWATLDLLSNGRVDFATGRGYDRKEYAPFGADFFASAEIFEEGIEVLLKAWNSPGKWSHKGKFYDIPEMSITPRPVQKPIPFYVASFSKTSLEMAAKRGLNIIYAPFAAGMVFGGLDKAVDSYREACVKHGNKPGRAMCSYFIFIADDDKTEDYGRQSQMDYFRHCVIQAFPQKKEDAPPTMQYFLKIVDILLKAWTSPGTWSHKGRFYDIPEMRITPQPVQKPIPFYIASFSKTSLEMAAKRGLNIIYAPFAAGMVFGGLDKAVDGYREACVKAGNRPGRAMCSYFIFIADDEKAEDYGRRTQMDYFNHCVLQAFPQKPEDAPPTMQYFMKIVDILRNLKKEDLSDKSILLGSPQKIIDTLKRVEKSGIEEVILYFNVGNKPHTLVQEQMHRFMEEIAPHFKGKHGSPRSAQAERA